MERELKAQTKVYYELYTPARRRRAGAYPLLIGLHGYAGNKESMMRLLRKINEADFVLATVDAPYRFFVPPKPGQPAGKIGFCWHTGYHPEDSIALHHAIVRDVIRDGAARAPVDTGRVFLLGFSQPVSLNYRFALTYPDAVRGVVAVCGGIPGDLEQNSYRPTGADVLHIAAEHDEYYPAERARQFKSRLAPYTPSLDFRVYKTTHIFPRRSLSYINQWLLRRAAPRPTRRKGEERYGQIKTGNAGRIR